MSYKHKAGWTDLLKVGEALEVRGLKQILHDDMRNSECIIEGLDSEIVFDYTRQFIDRDVWACLRKFCETCELWKKRDSMYCGMPINVSENRSVLHVALRGNKTDKYLDSSQHNVMSDVLAIRKKLCDYVSDVRNGKRTGMTGKKLRNFVYIGIGGSYLGPEFVYESLRNAKGIEEKVGDRHLYFLANIDPVNMHEAMARFSPEETMIIIATKTFTTTETMMNARIARDWLADGLHVGSDHKDLHKHMSAISCNTNGAREFGIHEDSIFLIWEWVGGRYSVTSAIGLLPIGLMFGWDCVEDFLNGARSIDIHFKETSALERNIPALMALLSFYNSTVLNMHQVAILPYSSACKRFPAHIQQLAMESNGKSVTIDGKALAKNEFTSEMYFGEPGTNAQHSFYQLLHQGTCRIQSEFIGFKSTQLSWHTEKEHQVIMKQHDELMANWFAQPDALAYGRDYETLKKQGIAENLIPHKIFHGNRVSTMLLLPECNARSVGQLIAMYEHRVAVQGWLYNIDSFDQWGVELGKELAQKCRTYISSARDSHRLVDSRQHEIPTHTGYMLKKYLS